MKCPVCKETNLTISERQGIEIDFCPECRGVWLDRGELDKIIERASGAQPRSDSPDRPGRLDREGDPRRKPRKSFLQELFD